jgi:peptide-methionine (S)-S-oxide reductase
MKLIYLALILGALGGFWYVAEISKPLEHSEVAPVPAVPAGAQVITLGGGCFWGTEAVFRQVPGVISITAGYMGGSTRHPTYEEVAGGKTGPTEVARVVFDPRQTDLEKILQIFWAEHNPTASNSAHARSVIFYQSGGQRKVAEKSRTAMAKLFARPIVTEISPAGEFYPAEEYHQNYYGKRQIKGQCSMAFSPELKALGVK